MSVPAAVRTSADLDLQFFGVSLKLQGGRIIIEDKGQATGASHVLKQGFEGFWASVI